MCGISTPLLLSKTQRSHWPPRSWSVVIYFLCKYSLGSNSTIRIFGEGNKTLHRHEENCNTEVHGGGELQLVKPAREPASSRSEPGASLKNLPRRLARSPLRVGSWSEVSFPPRNLPVDAFEFRAQGFSISLARQGTRFPLPSSTFYGTLKRVLRPTRLSTTFPPASRVLSPFGRGAPCEYYPQKAKLPPPLNSPTDWRKQPKGFIS